MSFLDFDITEVEDQPSGDFEPIPAGWYTAKISSAEVRDTKAGTGKYIAVRFDITGPTHEGRVVFTNLNIRNPNQTAENIGRQQLKQCATAIGVPGLKDTDQLIGGDLMIKVSIRKDEQYGDGNEVKGYKSVGATGAAPAPSAPSGDIDNPPWKAAS